MTLYYKLVYSTLHNLSEINDDALFNNTSITTKIYNLDKSYIEDILHKINGQLYLSKTKLFCVKIINKSNVQYFVCDYNIDNIYNHTCILYELLTKIPIVIETLDETIDDFPIGNIIELSDTEYIYTDTNLPDSPKYKITAEINSNRFNKLLVSSYTKLIISSRWFITWNNCKTHIATVYSDYNCDEDILVFNDELMLNVDGVIDTHSYNGYCKILHKLFDYIDTYNNNNNDFYTYYVHNNTETTITALKKRYLFDF
jgi:hypothetical protein